MKAMALLVAFFLLGLLAKMPIFVLELSTTPDPIFGKHYQIHIGLLYNSKRNCTSRYFKNENLGVFSEQ